MPTQEETELEIAAFMGPHIKRARIALVLIGILYAVLAYLDYGRAAEAKRTMAALADGSPEMKRLKDLVDLGYMFIVATGVAGVANIVLAAIAGVRTTLAIYAATAIFAAHSAFYLYVSGGAMITSIVWWMTAICVGMGFQAAWKAQQLRKQRGLPASL